MIQINSTQVTVVRRDIARVPAAFKIRATHCAGERILRQRYAGALAQALRRKKTSLAFEAGGSKTEDVLGLKAAAKIMAQEIFRHLHEDGTSLHKIVICAPDQEAYAVFKQHALGYLDYIANKLKSPFVTVDAIIQIGKGVVVIKRSNPPYGWALPGGFVDYGESLEEAVAREAREETGLAITRVRQFHTYSDVRRDPRFHTVGTVFTAQAFGVPRAGDDAAGVKVVSFGQIKKRSFAFDHKKILMDYIQCQTGRNPF